MKILVVDDERVLVKGIKFNLESEGYQVEAGYDGEQAVELARSGGFDLIILDLMMPKIDGLQACMRIREFSNVPIIMLTARSEDADKIIGFECGADDYITKPFGLMALRARVDRMRLRTGGEPESKKDDYADSRYHFQFEEMRFYVDGQGIVLSKIEQKLLRFFVRNPGQTLTRERLMDVLWGAEAAYVEENALSVAVNRLRRKLEGRAGYRPIETVYGLGYVWEKRT